MAPSRLDPEGQAVFKPLEQNHAALARKAALLLAPMQMYRVDHKFGKALFCLMKGAYS